MIHWIGGPEAALLRLVHEALGVVSGHPLVECPWTREATWSVIQAWGRRKLRIRIIIHLSWRAYQFQINKSLCECNLTFYLNILLFYARSHFLLFALIGPFIQNDLLSCNFLTLVRIWEMTARKWNRTFNQD